MKTRLVFNIVIAGAITISISSCDMGGDARGRIPAAVRVQSGNSLEFALCESTEVRTVAAEFALEPGEWKEFWKFDGKTVIESGLPVGEPFLRDNLEGESSSPDFSLGGVVTLSIEGVNPTDSLLGVFDLSGDRGEWIQNDGSRTKNPC